MSCYVTLEGERARTGKLSVPLTGEAQGAVAGCRSGVTHGVKREFDANPGAHADQEGFLVLAGHGEALVGDERIELVPGTVLIAPAGVPHTMRVLDDAEYFETFWFHAAVAPDSVPKKKVSYATTIREKTGQRLGGGHILEEENGCVNGCRAGIGIYTDTEFSRSGVHDDQEGFFVLEGTGTAKIGDTEFPVAPGTAFLCPANTWHSIRRDESCPQVTVFWYHSAVK